LVTGRRVLLQCRHESNGDVWRGRCSDRERRGRIEPGRVFDRTGSLDEVPEGYRLMNEHEVLKFLIKP